MLDETRLCLNPLPSIPEEGMSPRRVKYVKLPSSDHADPCAVGIFCAFVAVALCIVLATAVAIFYVDPCATGICNDFNITTRYGNMSV